MATAQAVKSRKPVRAKALEPLRPRPLHATAPWTCMHFPDHSEIKAYVLSAGGWVTIARIDQTASVDAEATANFIASAINDSVKTKDLVSELAAALEPCLAGGGLSWQAEHDANTALAHARQEGLAT